MHLLFDFDGTIADTLQLTIELFNQTAPKYHLPTIATEDMSALRKLTAKQLIQKSGVSPIQLPFLILDIQSAMQKNMASIPLITGLAAVLPKLKTAGHTLGIVTSNSAQNVRLFLDHHQLASTFDFVYGEKNLFGKGTTIAHALKTHHLAPEDTYYVGDEVRDIEAARVAKLRIISVSWGFNDAETLAQHHPELLFAKPSELLAQFT